MDKEFFNRNADVVARDLLGKIILRRFKNNILAGKIVETEAYFDEGDPVSRARQTGDLRETMMMEAGTILIYGIHNNWLMNFVVDEKNLASAVLIRSIGPLNFNERCNGPGLLTKALKIGKGLHKKHIFNNKEICIEDFDNKNISTIINKNEDNDYVRWGNQISKFKSFQNNELPITKTNNNNNFEIVEDFRIGVKKDLPIKLRFYIKDNKLVSKK